MYGVVYIDPPWTFEVRSENGKDRSEQNHYPTMTLDEIIELNIQADNNCALVYVGYNPALGQWNSNS